jgi:hypothetical protein
MNKSSLSVWRQTMDNVPNFPPCPPGMSEPQWVDLAFDPHCSVSVSIYLPINSRIIAKNSSSASKRVSETWSGTYTCGSAAIVSENGRASVFYSTIYGIHRLPYRMIGGYSLEPLSYMDGDEQVFVSMFSLLPHHREALSFLLGFPGAIRVLIHY